MMGASELLKMVVDSTASKSVVLSCVLAIGGYSFNQAVNQKETSQAVAWHTQAIKDMKANQDLLAKGLQEHTVTLSRIDGKLDVINQKIDDDRNYAQRHQVVSTR